MVCWQPEEITTVFIKFFDLEKKNVLKQAKAPMHVHEFTVNETYDTIYAAGHGKTRGLDLDGLARQTPPWDNRLSWLGSSNGPGNHHACPGKNR